MNNNFLEQYAKLISYLELTVGCPYYPEDILPVAKPQLAQLLTQDLKNNPHEADSLQRYINSLDHFIPYSIAMELAKDYQHVQRKHQGLEYNQEATKQYWKTIHALYGVDEQLSAG